MTATIGTATNTNTTAFDLAPISVGSSAAVTLLPGLNTPVEPPRIKVKVYHNGDAILWVRRYPASQDNDKVGADPVLPGIPTALEVGSDIYTGEISAIMDSGSNVDVYVTWY